MRLLEQIVRLFQPKHRRGQPAATPPPSALRSLAELDTLLAAVDALPAGPLIRSLARPCCHVLPDQHASQCSPGSSRLGGMPDLPSGSGWPTSSDGRLLTFYGQVKLADMAPAGSRSLPAQGLLSLFGGEIAPSCESVEACALLTLPGMALHTLTPPHGARFADGSPAPLTPVAIRCAPGLSFPTQSEAFAETLEQLAPDCDMDALLDGLDAAPEGRLGQLLGYAQFGQDDVHREAYFAEIGRARHSSLMIWKTWDDWTAAKAMASPMANGMIHRPWSADDDDAMRWIMDNRAAIEAGIAQWHCVLWIASNKRMDLWINDADPIYFLTKADADGRLDLGAVRAGATQS